MTSQINNSQQSHKEDISDYVAHLQVHMSLQSRNLLPQLSEIKDLSNDLLYQTQVKIEKTTSRELALDAQQ